MSGNRPPIRKTNAERNLKIPGKGETPASKDNTKQYASHSELIKTAAQEARAREQAEEAARQYELRMAREKQFLNPKQQQPQQKDIYDIPGGDAANNVYDVPENTPPNVVNPTPPSRAQPVTEQKPTPLGKSNSREFPPRNSNSTTVMNQQLNSGANTNKRSHIGQIPKKPVIYESLPSFLSELTTKSKLAIIAEYFKERFPVNAASYQLNVSHCAIKLIKSEKSGGESRILHFATEKNVDEYLLKNLDEQKMKTLFETSKQPRQPAEPKPAANHEHQYQPFRRR